MSKIFLVLSCLTVIRYQLTTAQCMNRQPTCNIMNEAIVETPRNLVSQPMTTFTSSNTIVETPCNTCNSIHPMSTSNIYPTSTTTIITDYSPTICKNLADTLQLMTVCNLLQNTKGTSNLALHLASPILKEVLSSPTFSCGCSNPLYSNPITPNLISSPAFTSTPNIIASPSFVSTVPSTSLGNSCNNGLLSNILGLISNLS